jgi:hypothetical protein
METIHISTTILKQELTQLKAVCIVKILIKNIYIKH